ncbi:hypothetical protein L1987_77375 [Smallanthus sonchifolius]|uniref:Uncharacterized protein n=1 Tax=Smallanthus sonchifolius TaxID=185202 RepID=A0ACB8ZAU9_9ASTR|nr:hypothetical protein L1987_77375 [Smallanthus sonchifolius]
MDSDSSDSDDDDVEDPVIQIWDVGSHLNAMAESETNISKDAATILNQPPLVKFTGHKDEGYAIDWSPLVPGRLVSASVEDLQWSPTEQFVFASCSVDKTIAIWDTRTGKSPATSFKAHETEINVISWNRLASCMLASGSDDGSFSIRDLRMLKGQKDWKELHWHTQIPGMLVSTAADGFNILMPTNIECNLPANAAA